MAHIVDYDGGGAGPKVYIRNVNTAAQFWVKGLGILASDRRP